MVEFYRDFDWDLDRFVEYLTDYQLKNHFSF
jgi:hypothetical protein